ncbi:MULTISPECIES: capreomycidine synthase [Streptomyces]|uniref:Capreomycidine synthase n=1 Tax=Streptomyces rubrolavendulae TaxID=285473 RepID=A0A1D8G7Q7_9ACTN|nr:capreomycidine synthase [Streptomyces rubrolavendulae]AOT61499.1 Capreomycidine synthase [Streptomyces rubrolavendulae]
MTGPLGAGPLALPAAPLEDWLRERYFQAKTDISSSGVHNYTFGELRALDPALLGTQELDRLMFRDGPSLGDERLRAAVAARVRPGPGHVVMTTHGSSEALFLAFTALLRPGDEVVVATPAYHSLSALAAAAGAVLRPWPLRPENGFAPDLADLRAVLSGRTRLVVVNFPHNPSGACVDPQDRTELLDLVANSGAVLLWDGAFTDLVHDHPPLADPSQDLDRVLTFGTLSKAYGLPGLRVGWCVVPRGLASELVRIRDYLTLSLSPLVERVAAVAVEHADVLIAPRLAEARRNRQLVLEWAAASEGAVDCPVPRGGVTAFPRFTAHTDVTDPCERLLARHGVLVVPGRVFGHADRMRIGFSCPRPELERGLAAISEELGTGARGRRRRTE